MAGATTTIPIRWCAAATASCRSTFMCRDARRPRRRCFMASCSCKKRSAAPAPSSDDMIVRIWRGREKKGHAGAYRRHLEGAVLPQLAALPGFMGASLLRRDDGGETEVLVMTRWASMEAVKAFSGPQPEI